MDTALKQRLLGAAVLIALAIIFVPMFFSNSPPKQDNTTLALSIPQAPERNFETRNLSVDSSPKPSTTKPAPMPAAPPAAINPDKVATVNTGAPATFEAPDQSASSPPAATKPPTAPATATPVAAKPAVAPAPPPAPTVQAEGRYVVNLGVYADAGGAAALVAKVKKLGYPAFAEATEYQGKAAQRVRVGPYADRAAAEGVRLKIKQSEEKVASSVVDLGDRAKADAGKSDKADAAATPTVPANRAGSYAVQVGAFKAEDEANKLRDRLRNGGVAAFIEKASNGEQVMWKVRAGPYADKGGAESARGSLKQKFQLDGIITTQP